MMAKFLLKSFKSVSDGKIDFSILFMVSLPISLRSGIPTNNALYWFLHQSIQRFHLLLEGQKLLLVIFSTKFKPV